MASKRKNDEEGKAGKASKSDLSEPPFEGRRGYRWATPRELEYINAWAANTSDEALDMAYRMFEHERELLKEKGDLYAINCEMEVGMNKAGRRPHVRYKNFKICYSPQFTVSGFTKLAFAGNWQYGCTDAFTATRNISPNINLSNPNLPEGVVHDAVAWLRQIKELQEEKLWPVLKSKEIINKTPDELRTEAADARAAAKAARDSGGEQQAKEKSSFLSQAVVETSDYIGMRCQFPILNTRILTGKSEYSTFDALSASGLKPEEFAQKTKEAVIAHWKELRSDAFAQHVGIKDANGNTCFEGIDETTNEPIPARILQLCSTATQSIKAPLSSNPKVAVLNTDTIVLVRCPLPVLDADGKETGELEVQTRIADASTLDIIDKVLSGSAGKEDPGHTRVDGVFYTLHQFSPLGQKVNYQNVKLKPEYFYFVGYSRKPVNAKDVGHISDDDLM